MNAVLFSKTGLFAGTSFKIGREATVGKGDGNTVILRADIVSGSHAKITYDDTQNAYFIEDLGSSNGTQLDGARVKGREKLERLHVITFAGKFDFIFQVGGAMPVKAEIPELQPVENEVEKTMLKMVEGKLPSFGKTEPSKLDKTMIDAAPQAPSPLPGFAKKSDAQKTVIDNVAEAAPALPRFNKPRDKEVEKTVSSPAPAAALPVFPKKREETQSDSEDRTELMNPISVPQRLVKSRYALAVSKLKKDFELRVGSTIIGRAIGCDIIIDDGSLSRKHAVITITGDNLNIKDLGSSNGTSVDGKRINTEVEILPSSVIKLGMVDVRIKSVS